MTDQFTGLERSEFATSDHSEARALIDEIYGVKVRVAAPPEMWTMALSQINAGAFSYADLTLPGRLGFAKAVRDEFVISTLIDGEVRTERQNDSGHFRAGDVFLATTPNTEWPGELNNVRVQAFTLPSSLVVSEADTTLVGGDQLRFLSHEPLAGGVPRWRQTSRLVEGLLAEPGAPASPLLIGAVSRLLAATVLTVFPNTAVTEPTIEDRHDGRPHAVRRAIAFMDANPEGDVGVADIARAAYVTPRALQLAFRRYLDTSPMAYLRRVRLNHAHEELLTASTGDGRTVTDIASRWGFTSSGFSRQYKLAYGQRPSETLRQ
jgi:AraC-like DNA-binding protein